jgi:hypothetical protein
MSHCNRAIVAALAAFAVQTAAPGAMSATVEASKGAPAKIERVEGTKLSRVTLTQKAAQRLDIRTGTISQDAAGKMIAPYAAVFYDVAGVAWVYTNPQPLMFVRHKVTIEQIKGASAHLSDGPPVGTQIVIVGVSELYGTEKGVGH